MRLPRVRFTVRWAAAVVIFVALIGVLAVIERCRVDRDSWTPRKRCLKMGW
jgi:hypothetical protein